MWVFELLAGVIALTLFACWIERSAPILEEPEE